MRSYSEVIENYIRVFEIRKDPHYMDEDEITMPSLSVGDPVNVVKYTKKGYIDAALRGCVVSRIKCTGSIVLENKKEFKSTGVAFSSGRGLRISTFAAVPWNDVSLTEEARSTLRARYSS